MTDERAVINLFHETLDRVDVSDPFQRLRLELEKPGAERRRRGRRIVMTRTRMVLLAAALIAFVLASVLVGTNIYRSLGHPTSQTVGHPGIDQEKVAQLLTRPLKFGKLSAGQPCPADGPITGGMFGSGPVYGQGGNVDISTTWGAYAKEFVITPPGLAGPVVLRTLNLKNGQPGVFLDPYGAGPVYGTDTVNGKKVNQYTAVAFDTDHSPKANYTFGTTTYVLWFMEHGWPHSTGFCTGIQIDGPAFTEVIYATVFPA